ncbi:uncharacterized protein [Haliotis cracherodii]|uniref:uncharacterized protein n=1 Tax=Haliotis cracherodii TaxID=6455 RepID=UPI0039E9858D
MRQATPILKLNSKPIKFQKQTKFLGLIFDEHLSWDAHVQNLFTKCSKDLNTLRCLTGSNWGASKDTLLTLYKLMGIATALHNQHTKNHKNILILTDSLSGLQALQNKNTKNRPKLIKEFRREEERGFRREEERIEEGEERGCRREEERDLGEEERGLRGRKSGSRTEKESGFRMEEERI